MTECASHVGIVGKGASVELMCQPDPVLGRYLVVQIPGERERLTLCEVQVYGGQYGIHSHFDVWPLEYHLITNDFII